MLARKWTRSWVMQSKPPVAAARWGRQNMANVLGLWGLFYTMGLGKKYISCFERIYLSIDKGHGKR